ncbi:MAG: biotin/acetyl-CoA-carboxylase ligase [Marmoricola sp.]|nr:biotin/acetyl-CoA-carboxylase ligase [Marmoricola sp.]
MPVTDGWRVEVVATSRSTNADVGARFTGGEGHGLVLVAEDQTAGRGRLGRDWVTPPRASLTVSFLVVPPVEVPAARWSWLPLLTGVAAADAVRRVAGVPVDLKWPNDLLAADGRKLGGILLERVQRPSGAGTGADTGDAAVVGIGLNCTQEADELPVPQATSLALAGASDTDRGRLLGALVEELDTRLRAWAAGEDLRGPYLERCVTPGQEVTVTVPGGELRGQAVDVDPEGRLVVRTGTGEEHLGAGDVVHVRPVA